LSGADDAPPLFGAGAPHCAPALSTTHRPQRWVLPPGSCDTHAHICGPERRYPYAQGRIYTPPDALLPDYLAMLAALGVERAVLVQPSVYGSDNSAMLDAMRSCHLPCRGVAVVETSISDAELDRLDAAGIRGVRFNLVDVLGPGAGSPLECARALAERIAARGWHTEFLLHCDDFETLDGLLADFPTDVVIGHIGYARSGTGAAHPGFQGLVRLVERGRCWVKLTGPYRLTREGLPYDEVNPFVRALAAVAPERLLWGSDWPHVMVTGTMPDDGELCDLLADWLPDATLRRQVMVDNPATLYGFTSG